MRKTAIALLVLGLVAWTSAFAANAVRISQVYGGSGSYYAYYHHDYVELFNSSSEPVSIAGWWLVWPNGAGITTWTGGSTVFPSGATIPACGYYLVSLGGPNLWGVELPVTADLALDYVSALGSGACRAGLFTTSAGNVGVECGSEVPGTLVDKIAYGPGVLCPEVANAPQLDQAIAGVRGLGGMTDTDNNSADFTAQPSASVVVHNSQSGTNPDCGVVPALRPTWGTIKTLYR